MIDPTYRQRYHFMAEKGWINDPNGFIQIGGIFHLFYQYHPYDSIWGPMHWGHAISKDLTHWSHLPEALFPDMPYDSSGCFSGSAIRDGDNLALFYTGNSDEQTQCLAMSKDLMAFEKSASNPILSAKDLPDDIDPCNWRDPKVIRIDDVYFMLVGAQLRSGEGAVLVFKGNALDRFYFDFVIDDRDHRIGRMWECPDIFSLSGVDILFINPQYTDRDPHYNMPGLHSAVYAAGHMDLHQKHWQLDRFHLIDEGFDFYAPQTLLDTSGRRIMIAWMGMWESDNVTHALGHGWSGSMTYPRELTLDNGKLLQWPIRELLDRRASPYRIANEVLMDQHLTLSFEKHYDMELAIDGTGAKRYTLSFHDSLELTHDLVGRQLVFTRGNERRGFSYSSPLLELRVLADTSSIECFVNGGQKSFSCRVFPAGLPSSSTLTLTVEGNCKLKSVAVYRLDL